ncbi:MAG: NADH-quinone oxidoreductase subunit L [Planctomycetes bacterium]|nr:NADH-quinone oxidoreductase subunit L [Planctomycetota bacterium]
MPDTVNLRSLMVLIPALPLAAALLIGALGKRMFKEKSHVPCVVAIGLSFICSLMLLYQVMSFSDGEVGVEHVETLWTWADVADAYHPKPASQTVAPKVADFNVEVSLRADPLTSIMLCMVTFIATLVAIYASGYMQGDPGYWRFFAYVSLFVFSMTMLVSVSNFALLYVFWEAVGVCSYLLIGFWYQKPEAAAAGKKAFLVNRIGDFAFALGVFLIWTTYGTLNFHDTEVNGEIVRGVLGQSRLANPALFIGGATAFWIAAGLMTGAFGKSAQFPLHVWLPDAMEGPTPVSALIHAATMVTAGVYLIARCSPLFQLAPEAQLIVSCIGGFTALLAGLIALTQNDLKRVMAYSTVSQLGYMFLSLGTGSLAGIVAGMFHLFTHAFFKALLFLGSGSVMHAMGHIIDMRKFSGLRHIMPWTFRTFWFGALALAGVVPFAGFWSKDQILAAVHHAADPHHHGAYAAVYGWLYYGALLTAFMTAFYTFRALFMTFYGPVKVPLEAGSHAHESPRSMTIPLMILAVCSLVVGAYFEFTHGFANFLVRTPSLAYSKVFGEGLSHEFHMDVAAISTVLALAGIALAAYLYLGDRREVTRLADLLQSARGFRLYWLSYNKFFLDQIYDALVVFPLRVLAWISYWLDRWVIDGLVNLVGRIPPIIGAGLRTLQGGLAQFYALAMMLGLLILMGTMLLWQPSGAEPAPAKTGRHTPAPTTPVLLTELESR